MVIGRNTQNAQWSCIGFQSEFFSDVVCLHRRRRRILQMFGSFDENHPGRLHRNTCVSQTSRYRDIHFGSHVEVRYSMPLPTCSGLLQ